MCPESEGFTQPVLAHFLSLTKCKDHISFGRLIQHYYTSAVILPLSGSCNYLENDSLWVNAIVWPLKSKLSALTKHLMHKTKCAWNFTLAPHMTHCFCVELSFSHMINKKDCFLILFWYLTVPFFLELHWVPPILSKYRLACSRDHSGKEPWELQKLDKWFWLATFRVSVIWPLMVKSRTDPNRICFFK